jgi:hypothetical protein
MTPDSATTIAAQLMSGFASRTGLHPEVQEQTAARGGALAIKLKAHVTPIVAGHMRH